MIMPVIIALRKMERLDDSHVIWMRDPESSKVMIRDEELEAKRPSVGLPSVCRNMVTLDLLHDRRRYGWCVVYVKNAFMKSGIEK